ncbi:CPBP family intramembrane metalloprotease [Candidatus Saccharibacteria bacterium]|nr:CPBP family intramembrane metalloprotease [Candidatus Saccharibacteria bacterium]
MSESSLANRPDITTKKKIAHVIFITVWVLFAFIATQIGALACLEAAKELGFRIQGGNQVLFVLLLNAVIYTIALIITVGAPRFARLLPKDLSTKKLLGIDKKPALSDLGMAIIAYLAYLVVSAVVMLLIIQMIPGFQADQKQEIGFESLGSGLEYIFAFLALVVMAPLAEELLFRGYLFGRLRSYTSFVPATIITSLLFALVHWQWNVGVDVFILSLALCYLREKTSSLWPAVFLHATKNGIAFTLLFVVPMSFT